ncbi:putative neuropeptide Y receptor 11 [Aphelenchoides bicaudatus]|nr:putative neuropeptide Y receptor 11 [Aphelenchoides bicaudatus]
MDGKMDSAIDSTPSSMNNGNTSSVEGQEETRDCSSWREIFFKLNYYFRDEDIIVGSEHSTTLIGYIIIIAYSLVIFLGVCGNLLTIIAILRNKTMRTARNFFILNLAFSDFFMCTVTSSITLYTVLYMFWPFGSVSCKLAGSVQGFTIFLSSFSISAIALDRYVLVIFPTKRERQHNLSLLFFSLIWIISFLLALPVLDASDLNVLFKDKNCDITLTICNEKNEKWQQMFISKEIYTIGVLVFQYSVPLISIAFVYTRIARRMGTRFAARASLPDVTHDAIVTRRRKSIADRQRRTHYLMICLVVVFAIAWLPLNVFHILNAFHFVKSFNVPTFAFCHVFAVFSAVLNPLSYAFFNQNFRSEFVQIFNQIGLIRLHDRLTSWLKVSRHPTAKTMNFTTAAETIVASTYHNHYNAVTDVDEINPKSALMQDSPKNTSDSSLVVVTNTV